jgi:hypothetical protein
MNDLPARKRELLARSEIYRRALVAECAQLEASASWITRTLHYARLVGPMLAMAGPIAAWAFRSRSKPAKTPPPKRNLLGKVLAGYQFARQIKPVWDGFRRSRAPY